MYEQWLGVCLRDVCRVALDYIVLLYWYGCVDKERWVGIGCVCVCLHCVRYA